MAGLFARIIAGRIPCHRVAEDERFLAFLDIAPLRMGHTLIVPKQEIDKFFELPADTLAHFLPFAQQVAERIERAVPCNRVGLVVMGLEVPHAHMHLIPIDTASDMDFARPKLQPTSEELAAMAALLRAS